MTGSFLLWLFMKSIYMYFIEFYYILTTSTDFEALITFIKFFWDFEFRQFDQSPQSGPSNDEWLSVDFWIFTRFCLFLRVGNMKLFCTSKRQFFVSVLQTFSNLGKFSEINKQFHVKSWLIYRSYSSVWWILSCMHKN